MHASGATQRYHSLDALRAAMMLLGLVLHSAASYTRTPLGHAWPYQDAQTRVAFDLLIFFIHLFRMPAFFVVAGFFAALLYYRDGVAGFVRNRVRRVALPLAIFWPATVPLVGLGFLFALRQVNQGALLDEVTRQPLMRQPLLGHLWFLYDLLFLYAAAAAIVPLAERLRARLRDAARSATRGAVVRKWGRLGLAAATTLTLLTMDAPALDTSATLLPPLRILAAYGVFFAFGWLLHGARELLASFADRWATSVGAGISVSAAYLFVIVARPIADPRLWHLAGATLAAVSIWLLIFGIVGLFVRHLEGPHPVVRYLSDASYWMYLVHLPATIWIPGLLARSTVPAVVKFGIVLGLTTLLTAITYHYFVRSTAIGELLNGRRYPRGLPVNQVPDNVRV